MFSNWVLVRDTGINKYYEHKKTGERKVVVGKNGYQPIDKKWLEGK
jgi:hypothetical protein